MAMESLKFHLFLAFVLIAYTLLLSPPVFSSHEYDLMEGMNSYRMSLNLSQLSEDPQAKCLADKLSNQLENIPCNDSCSCWTEKKIKDFSNVSPTNYSKPINASSGTPFTHYDKVLSQCNIGRSNATDAVILPICVPDPYPRTSTLSNYTTLLLRHYNRSSYQRYINDSKFTGFGADCQDDWMVVVLSTRTREGNLASAAVGLVLEMRLGVYLVALLLGAVGLVFTS